MSSDWNLVFGMIALQCDFITKEQFLAGMQAWISDKSKALGDILVEQKALVADERRLLDSLVQKHLARHDDDPARSLAALSSRSSADEMLRQLPDADVQASLGQAQASRADETTAQRSADENSATLRSAARSSVTNDAADADIRFRILRPHAKGGLGIVYVAHDREVNREVALKEIQKDRAGDENSRARFLLEAEITGGLEHPGIVPIYGLGHYADGRPFYAMRFIQGDSLKDAVDRFHAADTPARNATERDLSLRQLLRRFIDVCNAIEFAHSKGVLHRDLKPGNIMLGKFGETLVVDWGLAKATGSKPDGPQPDAPSTSSSGRSELPLRPASASTGDPTATGTALGTPAFMPPEQAEGRLDLLCPASDVYSLGATLYYVLTGKPPFRGNLYMVIQAVCSGTFPKPRQAKPATDAGLEAIVLKAMAHDIGARYPSAAALRRDIENWIADAPISARPDPAGVKVRRLLLRHRVLAATTAVAMVAGLAFLGILSVVTSQAYERERILSTSESALKIKAQEERAEADRLRGIADIKTAEAEKQSNLASKRAEELEEQARKLSATAGFAAEGAWDSGRTPEALQFLAGIPEKYRAWEWNYRRRTFQGSYATLPGHAHVVTSVAFSPDGEKLASGSADRTVKVWDARTGAELATFRGHLDRVTSVAFSPDGARLASASLDRTVKVWDVRTGAEIAAFRGHTQSVTSVAFSPDGERVASASLDRTVRIWDPRLETEIALLRGHEGSVTSVAWSPDGLRLASGSRDQTVRVWDARTQTEVAVLRGHKSQVNSVAFSPDGHRAASASGDQTARLWDLGKATEIASFRGHGSEVNSVAFSPDGLRLATGGGDNTVRLWDARRGAEIAALYGHAGGLKIGVNSVAFSPDGQRLASGGGDASVKLWEARTDAELAVLRGHASSVESLAFSPDGLRLASASRDQTVKLRNVYTGDEVLTLRGHTNSVNSVAFSPDGQRIATGSSDQTAKTWDARTGAPLAAFEGHTNTVNSVAFSPDGERLATASYDNTAKLWDARSGAEIATLRGHAATVNSVAFSPDGKRLASGSGDGTVKLWDARTGTLIDTLKQEKEGVESVAYSPDGDRLAVAGGAVVTVWNARTGARIATLVGHTDRVTSIAFSANGQRLASASTDRTVRLWDPRSGTEVAKLHGHASNVTSVAFSRDDRLASAGWDKTVKMWDGRALADAGSPDGRPRTLSEDERLYRVGKSRFDRDWHRSEAERLDASNRDEDRFAAAYHRSQLALHDLANAPLWVDFFRACNALGDDRLAFRTLELAVAQSPDMPAVYRARAQLRARYMQTAEATADRIMALVLTARAAQKPAGPAR